MQRKLPLDITGIERVRYGRIDLKSIDRKLKSVLEVFPLCTEFRKMYTFLEVIVFLRQFRAGSLLLINGYRVDCLFVYVVLTEGV